MMRNLRKLLPLVLLIALLLASCNTYTLSSKMQEMNSPELDMDVLYTAAAETVAADLATLQAPTPTPTPIPKENSGFLDFDHPRLHEIAGDNPLKIVELVRDDYHDASYVAVIVDTGDPMEKKEMLLFRVEDNHSTLIYDLGPEYYLTLNLGNENHPDWLLKNLPGYLLHMVPVRISNGGNCYGCSYMKVIDITEDGNAKDVTPDTDFVPKGFVYTTASDRTGRIDLVAVKYYEFDYGAKCHFVSPFAFRLFAWAGGRYEDVSEEETEFYDEKIMELENIIQKSYDEPFDSRVMPVLAQVFFNHESSGRVEYGWEQIQELGDLGHWDIENSDPEDIQTYHEVFEQLKQRRDGSLITATPSP